MPRLFKIPYGKTHHKFSAPKGVKVDVLESRIRKGLADPARALRRALAQPLASQPLKALAAGRKSACIVISDITRPVPNSLLLAEILPILEAAGIGRDKITILVGTGTHRGAPADEIKTLVGPDIAKRYRVVNHDCKRGNVHVGKLADPITKREIPLEIDRLYVNADLKIVTGLVEPHIFCGFSGGRKAILPGIASLSTIRKWHSPEIVGHPKSTPGVLQGNVAHRLTTKAAKIIGADFAVNVTLNRDREVTGVFAGDIEAVFAAAVERLTRYVLTQPVAPAKVVVTSSAGWPLDQTLYQAIKGLVAILPVMAKGGIVVLVAKCDEGLGDSSFEGLIRGTKDVVKWSKGVKSGQKFELGQWQWQRMGWTRERGRVFIVSQLSDCDAHAAFCESKTSLNSAVREAVRETGAERIVVVPEGPYVITRPR